jgi:hypothetical protein
MDRSLKISFLIEFQKRIITEYSILKKKNQLILTNPLVSDVESLIHFLLSTRDNKTSHIRARQLYTVLRDTMICLDGGEVPSLGKTCWEVASGTYAAPNQTYLESYFISHLYFDQSIKGLAAARSSIIKFLRNILDEISRFTGVLVTIDGASRILELSKYDYSLKVLNTRILNKSGKGKTPEQIIKEFQMELAQTGSDDNICREVKLRS